MKHNNSVNHPTCLSIALLMDLSKTIDMRVESERDDHLVDNLEKGSTIKVVILSSKSSSRCQ